MAEVIGLPNFNHGIRELFSTGIEELAGN